MNEEMMKTWVENGWASWKQNEEFPTIEVRNPDSNEPIIIRLRPDLPGLPVLAPKKDVDNPLGDAVS